MLLYIIGYIYIYIYIAHYRGTCAKARSKSARQRACIFAKQLVLLIIPILILMLILLVLLLLSSRAGGRLAEGETKMFAKGWVAQKLFFSIGSGVIFSKGWVRKDTNLGLRSGCIMFHYITWYERAKGIYISGKGV